MDTIKILQISDLYFETEDEEEREYRLTDLLEGIKRINENGKIDYILVTKGVAVTEFVQQYREARIWMAKLSEICDVPMQKMYLCLENEDNRSEVWICEYNLNLGKPEGDNCIRTLYELRGSIWRKTVQSMRLELPRKRLKANGDSYRYSILWWTRIETE